MRMCITMYIAHIVHICRHLLNNYIKCMLHTILQRLWPRSQCSACFLLCIRITVTSYWPFQLALCPYVRPSVCPSVSDCPSVCLLYVHVSSVCVLHIVLYIVHYSSIQAACWIKDRSDFNIEMHNREMLSYYEE